MKVSKWKDSLVALVKQPISSTHLKVSPRLLTRVKDKGGREPVSSRVLFRELLGKLQENLTEVLWQQLWPLYTTHSVGT